MLFRIFSLILGFFLFFPPAPAAAEEIARARLISEQAGIEPGKPFRLGLLLELPPGWHTYWENPGDAGLAAEIIWTLPPGFSAGAIDWPGPERIQEGPLTVYGYYERLLLPVPITAPADLPPGDHTLRVNASWLVCKDICIPESKELEITLPATVGDAALFAEHDRRRPAPLPNAGSYRTDADAITLSIPRESLPPDFADAYFFIRQSSLVTYSGAQSMTLEGKNAVLSVPRAGGEPGGDLRGVLSVESGGARQYFDLSLAPAPLPSAARPDSTFLVALFSALLGGLILNLMPCVLPVLSLKALAIAKKSGRTRGETLRLGIAYTLGILVSFALLAGVLIALQQAGEAVGWGFQMQAPAFVAFLVYLLFLVALNLFGLFEVPATLGHLSVGDESSARGSFLTGVLAAAVATPCTAPFMASAVGYALGLPPLQALLIFQALGLGLALPFLLLSAFPALLRFLPKPGPWMERLKHLLAWPMIASVLWLLWVLAQQTGIIGPAIALAGLALIVLAVRKKRLAPVVIAALLLSLPMIEALNAPPTPSYAQTVPYSPEKLAELRAAGKPVFVDATAAWCITCQVNARVAIHTERTMALFKERGITLMVADWTRYDPAIRDWLAGFGYQGVPLYVFYPAGGGEPRILPQLLTEAIVADGVRQ